MSYADPDVRPLLDLEGLKQWLPGRTRAYAQLERAVDANAASTTPQAARCRRLPTLRGSGLDEGGHLLLVTRPRRPASPVTGSTVQGRHRMLRMHLAAWCRMNGHRLIEETVARFVVKGSADADRWTACRTRGNRRRRHPSPTLIRAGGWPPAVRSSRPAARRCRATWSTASWSGQTSPPALRSRCSAQWDPATRRGLDAQALGPCRRRSRQRSCR